MASMLKILASLFQMIMRGRHALGTTLSHAFYTLGLTQEIFGDCHDTHPRSSDKWSCWVYPILCGVLFIEPVNRNQRHRSYPSEAYSGANHRWIFLQHIRFHSTFTLHSKGQFPSTFYYINVKNWRFPTTVNNDFICKFIQVCFASFKFKSWRK